MNPTEARPEAFVNTLVVVGTGFMGASIAAGAKAARVANCVIGVDAAQASTALSCGHVDLAFASIAEFTQWAKSSTSLVSGLAVVVASPVPSHASVFAELEALDQHFPLQWLTDIGSTKHGVISAANQSLKNLLPRFVSSHPMAGSEHQGAAAANPALIHDARVLVSRLASSSQETVDAIEAFWIALGGRPAPLPIEDHDVLLAAISHLPHVLAFSLASSLAQSPLAGAAQLLHGGGLRDTTRIAASSPELWADIFLDNRESLLQAWGDWSLQLQEMRQALESSDRELLIDFLHQASQWRRGLQT